jgi:hypothetical protein
MLTHFLYALYMYHFFSLSLSSCLFFFQGALTHATICRGLTMKYKLESVEKKEKRINSVNCHHFHMINSTLNASEIDNEIKA